MDIFVQIFFALHLKRIKNLSVDSCCTNYGWYDNLQSGKKHSRIRTGQSLCVERCTDSTGSVE